ncbi:glycoside hydrolase family 28 protein [Flagellimonas hymeniacidonis]|uniref:Glycoside hydrolase family 28 protein n=1 Tax=Flagellimonas hymeniacidonis TaxID=2603628 RepID=A0A5C8V373_9FLAO|nr:glycosyl hydrolase family 28 protein [Flagellimonas hymeniacidonis]TXN35218.1 glycoside hydrolase family 28 protein [Flagellimonas hymeniacidonis]
MKKRNILLLLNLFITISYANSYKATLSRFNIKDFGAVDDGKTINTKFIQKAINAAHEENGGVVVFPKGKFVSGTLIIKSNIHFLFEEGSFLLGSKNPGDYPKLDLKNERVSSKTDDNSKLALIWGYKANNISITGKGIIDGQGRPLALAIDSLHHKGVIVDPNYSGRPSETLRPKIINFLKCEKVAVSGITIKNSASWVQTYDLCKFVTIENIKVNSTAYWNNDGINITDSRHVRIRNCDVNAADDGITLKSYFEDEYNDDVIISNCRVRSSASAIKFGTASIGGFKNITIDSISVYDTFRSAIAIETVDGGFIENVHVSNINAINTGNAIFVRLGYRSGKKPGKLKNVTFKNIKVQIPFGRPDLNYDLRGPATGYFHNRHPASIVGIQGANISGVVLENVEISYPGRASKGMAYIPLWRLDDVPENIDHYPEYTMFGELPSWAFYVRYVEGITFNNIKLRLEDSDYRPAFVFHHVQDIAIENLELPMGLEYQIVTKGVQVISADSASSNQIKKFD